MSARPRPGALTFGLALIALGIIFFLENLYADFSAWRLIARYWPLFLIFIGLRKLYGHFTWQEVPPIPSGTTKE
jgi:hypothetical protein